MTEQNIKILREFNQMKIKVNLYRCGLLLRKMTWSTELLIELTLKSILKDQENPIIIMEPSIKSQNIQVP